MRILNPFKQKSGVSRQMPPRVSPAQWLLATLPLGFAATASELIDYRSLALMAQMCAAVSLLLLILITREAVRLRVVGKCCLVAGVFVFYWLDAVALSLQRSPFAIPEGFPISASQFNQDLIRQGLMYVAVFQLLMLVGYSIRPRFDRPLTFLASRIDSLSFDRSVLGLMLMLCAILPIAIYLNFDFDKIIATLVASRSGSDFDGPEPGLAQHLALFGIYGSSLFFVYALKANTWRRFWWLFLGALSALPFLLSGTRHLWLYIALPSIIIILRGYKDRTDRFRLLGLAAAVGVFLLVAQLQFAYRAVGWSEVRNGPTSELTQVNTNGHFTALMFAEHIVPNQHAYFRESAEFYFLIHWIPRQLWREKPIMESWSYYNDTYVQGASVNVTPSVIGQFHMNWGLFGVFYIGFVLGFLTMFADRLLMLLDPNRQRALFVVLGMFYAFIISSFRFYSPIYFSFFVFGLFAMFLLTRPHRVSAIMLAPQRAPA
jgi:oligosaccharide repeat unit polymerase